MPLSETGTARFIVMELLAGETLQTRLERGALPLGEALETARQIANGLSAAHDNGIVHRDLKPANVFLTANGPVKILDFGLARNVGTGGDETTGPRTARGRSPMLGTVPYVSPEQARGEPVDKRTDVWAFACVLFEMIVGTRAFAADTVPDTTTAILEKEPDWRLLPAATPAAIRRLLCRCLSKDPHHRLHDIADARIVLEEQLDIRNASGETWDAVPARRGPPILAHAVVAIAAAAGTLALAWVAGWVPVKPPSAAEVRLSDPRMLTFSAGVEHYPAWSPDGRTLAFSTGSDALVGTGTDVWIVPVAGGEPLNRTIDHYGVNIMPSWLPDGVEIAFRSDRDGPGIYTMSAISGAPRKFLDIGDVIVRTGPPVWSRDGNRLVVASGDDHGPYVRDGHARQPIVSAI